MQKSMWDFYPHAFINMQPLCGGASQSYWVKCMVISEFSDKTRKNKLHKQINETSEAQWAANRSRLNMWSPPHCLFIPSVTFDTETLRHSLTRHVLSATEWESAYLLVTHSIKHRVAAGESVCITDDCTYRDEGRNPCGHLSAVSDVLRWRSDREGGKHT